MVSRLLEIYLQGKCSISFFLEFVTYKVLAVGSLYVFKTINIFSYKFVGMSIYGWDNISNQLSFPLNKMMIPKSKQFIHIQ